MTTFEIGDDLALAWARLGHTEIQRRLRAEFCERCAATETQPCVRKNKTTLTDYVHAERYEAAAKTFRKERRRNG